MIRVNSFYKLHNSFLDDYKIGGFLFPSVTKDNIICPTCSTAIDKNKISLINKSYQERLERFRLGINFKNKEYVKSFSIKNKKIHQYNREDISFGESKYFGTIDTTGTASYKNSEILKKKCMMELIEKNEGALFWYLKKGYVVDKNAYVNQLINNIGFYCKKIYIFSTSNLTNYNTCIVLLCNNRKIVASGINCESTLMKALENSLIEAKLLESIYRDSCTSPYIFLTDKENEEIYEYILQLNETLEKKSISIYGDKSDPIKLADWIDIEYIILNNKLYEEYITIECMSKDLLNSVGVKCNILKSKQVTLVQKYKLYDKVLGQCPECPIY